MCDVIILKVMTVYINVPASYCDIFRFGDGRFYLKQILLKRGLPNSLLTLTL